MIKTASTVTLAKTTYEDLLLLASKNEVSENYEYLLRCKAAAELLAQNEEDHLSWISVDKKEFNAIMANELKEVE